MNYADRKKMVLARKAIEDYENMQISALTVKELRKLVTDIVTDVVDNTQHRKNIRDNENRRAAGLLPYPSPSEFAVMEKWGGGGR